MNLVFKRKKANRKTLYSVVAKKKEDERGGGAVWSFIYSKSVDMRVGFVKKILTDL